MSLCDIVRKFEDGNIEDSDLEHPLARSIIEEMAEVEESPLQRKLWDDAKILADHIIESYLSLDREDKLKMAEVYATTESLNKIGGGSGSSKSKGRKSLGTGNYNLLLHISNYSKLIPVIKNYISYAETAENIKVIYSSLTYYLLNFNIRGEQVKVGSNKSMRNFYSFDFISNSTFKRYSINSLVDSLTYRVKDQELIAKVRKYALST